MPYTTQCETGKQYTFTLTRTIKITAAPARFAPGVEPLQIDYDIAGLAGARVALRVRSVADPAVLYERELSAAEKASGPHKALAWDGKATDGKFIDPVRSPYEVTLAADVGPSDARQVKVELDALTVVVNGLNERRRAIMNDPAARLEVVARARLKTTEGSAADGFSIPVKFTFTDDGAANATSAEGFAYQAGKSLGKASDPAAVYWESHADSPATSTDGFKTECTAKTAASGSDPGTARAWFRPSGVGGDDFKVKAAVLGKDGVTELVTAESQPFAVWRRIEFCDVYTMKGETYIDTATTNAEIGPAFENDAFVEYERIGAVVTLDPSLTVDYIGLYKAGGGMKNWPDDFSPVCLESSPNQLAPTADELAAYADVGADAATLEAKAAAKAAIEAKAQAWFDKIVADYGQCVSDWFSAVTLPAGNALLAVRYYHPKLSNAGGGATNFWPAGISINLANPGSGLSTPGHPDQATWREVQGFNRGNTSVIFKNYSTSARLQIVCRHEIGHATRSVFQRKQFGTGDHSASGLMTPYGASNTFSAADVKVLRGYA